MDKEATIIQNFNAEKRKYEYSIKGYNVTKSIEILLKMYKEKYDKERRVFESTRGYLEAQQEYEKRIVDLQSQLDQLKQQLAEKDIRIEELEGQFAYECECNKQLVELQKQLEKKQNEIDEINKEFVQAVHDWKALCANKDKEIEKLKSEIVKECKEHQDFIKEAKQITNQLKSNYQTQLAIQELEKVKTWCDGIIRSNFDMTGSNKDKNLEVLSMKLDQQINELKRVKRRIK